MNNNLTASEQNIILHNGTEPAFTGAYTHHSEPGTYLCRQCNQPLFKSEDKFSSHCGWPSFDDEIENSVTRSIDADGKRIEITCSNCNAHLGHVFDNEGFTSKNIRHCVNSASLYFIPVKVNQSTKLERAIFAGGCFWGVEYYMQKERGVIHTAVGYIGGQTENPTYEAICTKSTGHAEAIEVFFDVEIMSYEKLTRIFFEIHDPTQINRQGPDVGEQYRSEIFYLNETQKQTAEKVIKILRANNYKVVTKVTPATKFFVAEDYHQNYYDNKGTKPYCHFRTARFMKKHL